MSSDQADVGDGIHPDDPSLVLQLTQYTTDALWMFTRDWRELVYVNSAYEDIFGQSTEALAAEPTVFLDAVHPADRERVERGMQELGGGSPVDIEFRVDPDNDYRTWVWVQGQPVYDDSGDFEYIAGYTRDITERKRYQHQLEQHRKDLERSNESLREFAYIASHDLQEPLRMVSSYIDLLEEEYGDQLDGEAAEYMDFAVNGARRMKRMINSLLEYSRVHTEADEFEATDANRAVESTRQDLELLIEDHDATVTVEDLPTVRADPDQLRQVFQNLVKNAIDHADGDREPTVEIRTTEREDDHVFAVADDGPGVPAGSEDEIFKIFQGQNAAEPGNSGIGLAIAKRIVQRHGGSIWVESPDGEGATFKFTIPKSRPQDEEELSLP